jgi:hypothetical protein
MIELGSFSFVASKLSFQQFWFEKNSLFLKLNHPNFLELNVSVICPSFGKYLIASYGIL